MRAVGMGPRLCRLSACVPVTKPCRDRQRLGASPGVQDEACRYSRGWGDGRLTSELSVVPVVQAFQEGAWGGVVCPSTPWACVSHVIRVQT